VANIETIIVSHVRLEVPYSADPHNPGFIPRPIVLNPQSEDHFQQFLGEVFKGEAYTKVRSAISTKYPRNAYTDQIARAAAVITDSSFTCNTRHIIDTYLAKNTKVYALDYRLFDYENASTHASDLIMTFFNKDVDIEKFDKFVECVTSAASGYTLFVQTIQNIRQRFQQLFVDHAIWGVPNGPGRESKDFWPPTSKGPCLGNAADSADTCVANLMSVGGENVYFDARYPDPLTPASVCNFWKNVAQAVAKAYVATGDQQLPKQSSQQIVLHEDQL
jgi:Carboxylesterase family